MTVMTKPMGRRVAASMSLTLDGRYNGPGGPGDLSAIVPYMTTGVARDHLTRIWQGGTTALLGRRNAEGFMGFWLDSKRSVDWSFGLGATLVAFAGGMSW